MEGLDLLKQQWKQQDESLPSYKTTDFYKMLVKKSSSIVKWIFYISIIEFVFWTVISIVYSFTEDANKIEEMGLSLFNTISYIISYAVLIYFIYKFYKNYKNITADDSIKGLMKNILETRRTVKHYVWFNIIFFAISYIIVSIVMFNNAGFEGSESVPVGLMIAMLTIMLLAVIALLLLFYRIVYGILTRRLKKNYNELERIED